MLIKRYSFMSFRRRLLCQAAIKPAPPPFPTDKALPSATKIEPWAERSPLLSEKRCEIPVWRNQLNLMINNTQQSQEFHNLRLTKRAASCLPDKHPAPEETVELVALLWDDHHKKNNLLEENVNSLTKIVIFLHRDPPSLPTAINILQVSTLPKILIMKLPIKTWSRMLSLEDWCKALLKRMKDCNLLIQEIIALITQGDLPIVKPPHML